MTSKNEKEIILTNGFILSTQNRILTQNDQKKWIAVIHSAIAY